MKRILIIAPNWIGDAVMIEPLIRALHLKSPESSIDVLATPWVASVMRFIPLVNDIIQAPLLHGKLQWKERRQLATQLETNNYHEAYVLPNSFKSALIPWLANIPKRIGYLGEWRWGLLNQTLSNPSRQNRPPMHQHYLALAGQELSPEESKPRLICKDVMKSRARDYAKTLQNHEGLYIFCPGAEYGPAKQWPSSHYAELAKALSERQRNATILILGSNKEKALGDEIVLRSQTDRIINLCGKTSLDDAVSLISVSQGVVSNDSGLMHIAAALGIPQVAIFGSSDPRHTPPLSNLAKIHWLKLDCSPCFKRTCPLGHYRCLVDIQPQTVLNSLEII
ncbi:MAG: lipopolysaccharide heptosyltransferase II [Burkholderiaceae bacterium]|jgi:heptosyltransferase-2|nr:lipopolysaccharide heptosyltransferase II [Burkholderiaceae bacterium]